MKTSRRVWGAAQKARYQVALAQVLRTVRDHPLIGQARDDLFPGCRSVSAEHHVIYYHQPQPDEIEVVRILHRHQDARAVIEAPRS